MFACEHLGIDGIPLLLELKFYTEAIRILPFDRCRFGDMPIARVIEKRVSVVTNVEGHILPDGTVRAIPELGVFAHHGDSDGGDVDATVEVYLQIYSLLLLTCGSRLRVNDLLAVLIGDCQDGLIGVLMGWMLSYNINVEVNGGSALEVRHVYDLVTRDLQLGASREIGVFYLIPIVILQVPVDFQAVVDTPLFHELFPTIL